MQEQLKKRERRLGLCVLLVMMAVLLPLFLVADYAHPSVDDYSYGKLTADVWKETGSIGSVIVKAWERTAYTYETHQGTFASVFLMRLQPGIFGEEYYFLTTVFLLGTFLLCSILFYYVFFCRIFKAEKMQSWIIAGVLSLGAVQFTHVVSDSFYWYNGGVTYTFFYSMEALLFAMLIVMCTAKRKLCKILAAIACVLLAVIACGGNYVTALVTLELLFFVCLVSGIVYYKKEKAGSGTSGSCCAKWNLFLCVLVLLAAAVSFFVVVAAPGNAARQERTGETTNPVLAIVLSFVYGAYSLGNCMDLPALALLFFCVPLFVVIARKSCEQKRFLFPYPGLVTFFSFCLYSSQVTPVIYAQGIKIPYRIMNIIYFSCFVMVALNLFYWIGYFSRFYEKTRSEKTQGLVLQTLGNWHTTHFWKFYAVATLLLCFSVAGNISIAAEVDVEGATQVEVSELPATLSACYFLFNGDAKVFDKECKERYTIYSNPDIMDVVVEPFTVTPDIIFHSDITEDPDNWKNKCIKKYFNKHSVRLAN